MTAARRIHLDCETYRTTNSVLIDSIVDSETSKKPAHNVAKSVKDKWFTDEAINERVQKALDKTSVNPMYAEVLVTCCRTDEGELFTFDAMEQSEKESMIQFSRFMSEISDKNTIWTAFNGKRFDFSLLLNRMIRHRVRPPEHFPVYAGGWRGRIFDTMERLPTSEIFVSFKEACDIYGLNCKTTMWGNEPMGGARVGEAYRAGEFQLIRDYCAADTEHEEALYLAMTHNDTWGTYDVGDDLSALSEIYHSDDSPAYKWSAAAPILKSAGLI